MDRDILKLATFSKQVLLHSITFFTKSASWKKLIFQKSNMPHYLLFLDSLDGFLEQQLSQNMLPSIADTFLKESYNFWMIT